MRFLFFVAGLFVLTGCGDGMDGRIPATGTIMVDGKPAAMAAVAFIPVEGTAGTGGTALTDSRGQYEILTPQGKKGVLPGKYKVTIGRRLNPDGSLPDPNMPPMDSQARETLPSRFTDRDKTDLTAVVEPGRTNDFSVTSLKKK